MSKAAKILLVEDERSLAEGICENLEAEGYSVAHVAHGVSALERILAESFDLIVLDVMLPGLDGFSICRRVRDAGLDVPVLFLTAKGDSDDRIKGLDAGADDYLSKPFRLQEFLLRVQAILRRRLWLDDAAQRSTVLRFGGNEFDVRSMLGRSWDGQNHELTQKEAMILQTLADREGEVVSRDEILDQVWGYEVFPSSRTIDNFIVRLRKRFERRPEEPVYFHTVRGIGYRFTRQDES
jgi:two-component system alkaline phosphatase synthesis response regulator PhoP